MSTDYLMGGCPEIRLMVVLLGGPDLFFMHVPFRNISAESVLSVDSRVGVGTILFGWQ